jgi:hypothetical protein
MLVEDKLILNFDLLNLVKFVEKSEFKLDEIIIEDLIDGKLIEMPEETDEQTR